MKFGRFFFAGLALWFLSYAALAQENFVVATGNFKTGTYSQMLRELSARCPNPAIVQLETNGSATNVDLLTSNKVNAAVVQSDLLFFTKRGDPAKVANIKTLFGLHPEELHFVARADTKKEGGVSLGNFNIGGKSVSFNSLADLAGRPVGAVGGSVLSANVVSAQSKLNFTVREYANNDELKKALLAGAIDAALVVGGSPHPLVASLDRSFRLLPVSPDTQKALAGVYAPAKLSYSNLGQSGIDAVSTQALMVTRTYRSQTMLGSLAAMRACFEKQLPEIQDSRGSHAKWQAVDAAEKGKWDWYTLP